MLSDNIYLEYSKLQDKYMQSLRQQIEDTKLINQINIQMQQAINVIENLNKRVYTVATLYHCLRFKVEEFDIEFYQRQIKHIIENLIPIDDKIQLETIQEIEQPYATFKENVKNEFEQQNLIEKVNLILGNIDTTYKENY